MKDQKPAVLWFTGLSGSGKSTIANLLEKKLHAAGQPHLHPRRRQCPPRAQPRSRLHRRRPRREHPPRRRSGEADGRCRPDRAGLVHLAVPRRAPHGARADGARASSSRSSSTRRSRNAPGATRRASTRKALSGEIKNFTGVDSPYEAPENPEIHLETLGKIARGDGRGCSKPGCASATLQNSNTTTAAASDDRRSLARLRAAGAGGRPRGHGRLPRRHARSTQRPTRRR